MRQLTIERTAAVIIFLLLFALAVRIPADSDMWWHITSGEYTLTHGMIHADPFSFTKAGEPWINHSWGAQLVLYGVWTLAGSTGLALYTAALATAGMYVIYRTSSGSVYLRAFVLVLGAAAAAVFWSPRPQMFSFLLSAVVLYLLRDYTQRGRDRLWWLVPLMVLWVNLHAGFSIGFILLGGYVTGEALTGLSTREARALHWGRARRLAVVTAVCIPALALNPYGLQIYSVPFQTVSIGALQDYIQEWNSPNFHERYTWPFIALLLAVLGAVGAGSRRLTWTSFGLLSVTIFMSLTAGRNIALFAVVATPVLTDHLDAALTERGWVLRTVRRATPRMARLNLLLVLLVLVGALLKVVLVLDAKAVREAQAQFMPLDAVAYLESAQPDGPIFNSYNWGGYLIFAAPQHPVFVDGRTDLYGDAFLTKYLDAATGGPAWRMTLDEYGIRLVLMEANSGLARELRADAAWTLAYEDDLAVVFTREAQS
jgi:hypothetical protein